MGSSTYRANPQGGLVRVCRYNEFGVRQELIGSYSGRNMAETMARALNKAVATGRTEGAEELLTRFDQDNPELSEFARGWVEAARYLLGLDPLPPSNAPD